MRVLFAERTSHNLVTFNDTQKYALQGRTISITQTSGSKFHRQPMRELSTPKLKLWHQTLA